MADQTFELYTGSATGTQIDAAAAKVDAMEEVLSGTAATIPSSAAVKNYVDGKSVDTVSTLSGGVVYDISEANNGTTYANLAAALNNGNNIPASIRKGGISIKFIQSSDNKYVQYRLMAQAFSTTVSDWQGVDDAPTANSKNLVTSGGVHGALLNYTTTDALTLLLAGKQDVISDLATIRNGAASGATAYQKSINGIPKNDLSESVQTSLNKADTALQVHQDISSKEDITNKKTTIIGNESSSTYYPSTKAVADYVHQETAKWGVVSQTFTESGNYTIGYTLTPSDPVYGYIPQSFIDIVEGYFSCRYAFPIASFNETTGYFELNGITNIAYDEMLRIYNYGDIFRYYSSADLYVIRILDGSDKFIGVRTLLPTETQKNVISNFFRYCSIEVLRCSTCPYISVGQANIQYAFYNNLTYLREIQDEIRFTTKTASFDQTTSFRGCPSLEKVTINKLPTSIAFLDSPNLSIESILYMINHENAPSAITITLHPTAYARAIADSDVQAALQAHTNVTLAST